MTLKQYIDAVIDPRIFRVGSFPRELKVDRVSAQIQSRFEQVRTPEGFEREAFLQKLYECSEKNEWDKLTDRDLQYVPTLIWSGEQPLADRPSFLAGYLGRLRRSKARIPTKALIRSFFIHFDPENFRIALVGQYLSEEVGRWRWPWSDRQIRYAVFDPHSGPRTIARCVLEAPLTLSALAEAGLWGDLIGSAYGVACFSEAAQVVQQHIQSDEGNALIDKLVEWVAIDNDGLRIRRATPHLADALLIPWIEQEPSSELRNHISNVLLRLLKDPRVERTTWASVAQRAKAVFLRWLAQASLDQFLAVVDRTALRHQWELRRAFWGAYIKRGYIQDAWVVFGPNGRARASQMTEDNDRARSLSFGTLRGGSSDHAVLLMQIGGLTIADWSHNGALRVWEQGNKHSPKLHNATYYTSTLRHNADFEQPHLGDWQRETRNFIQRHTGIHVSEHEYSGPNARR